MLEGLRHLFSSARKTEPGAMSSRPRLEVLEDRTLPSASVAENMFPTTSNGVSFIDRLYLTYEAQGDQQEMILGQIAQTNSTNPAVQLFGRILTQDHQNSFNDIKTVLQDAGLPVPGLSLQNLQNIQMLAGLQGQEFDTQFTQFMAQDHVQDVEITMAEQMVGTFPEAKADAASSLPVLDTHLLIALVLQPGGQQSGGGSSGG